ncbi:TonB-dependent siderophore receptor [Variovorax sp. Sphag1AA]|uniref:TonB-dependent siderophore receptor n=1 Tax=Variovorax sp. Sphag1AA TaxID=2587027 RepID=UPI00160EE299|nr:TonB-dependent siderophore receptor [Variovorax sp. Sphag1AA]MBB3177289.1 iron complex outermembrane receptor protein [Variovorax sp. Sphag1AA]
MLILSKRGPAATLIAGCVAMSIQHQTVAQTSQATLPEVRVDANAEVETATSPVIGYRARNAASATKTDTPLSETPQSVTIVTRDEMIDQGATNIQDALNYAAGVRSDAYGLDSRTDSALVRGGNPDEYLDGLRKNFDWYTSNARTDPYTLERIEVLRGPSAMLFGQGSTAGVVNMVSKRPQAETQREVGMQFGSWNRKQLQADLTGPLTEDGQWLYRLIAVARNSDTQVDYVPDDRQLIAPSLTWRPNAQTSLTLQALYQKDKTGSTSQFFPWEGVVLPNPNGQLPTSRFIGEPGYDRYNTERSTAGWLFEHKFNDDWSVRQNLRFARNNVDYTGFYGDSFTEPGGWAGDPVNKRLFGRFWDSSITKVNLLTTDQNIEGRFNTGALEHQVLTGVDYARYSMNKRSASDYPIYLGGNQPLIDAYAPVYGVPFPTQELVDSPKSTQRQVGVYLQDQMKFAKNWIVIAGVRNDDVSNGLEGSDDEKSNATSKRFALMYAADNGISPYISYGESFTPVAGLNANDQRFTPQRGKQWEGGIKYLPNDKPIAFAAAVYDLREDNRLILDPNGGTDYVQAGSTKTRGAEFEFKATLAKAWDLVAFYNYTDLDPQLTQVPRNQAAVWAKYRFALVGVPGFSVGAGVRWMSSFKDGVAPETPAVTLLDAMVAYETAKWRFALNISNLTDKVYSSVCLSRGDCWYGARRNAIASASYRF